MNAVDRRASAKFGGELQRAVGGFCVDSGIPNKTSDRQVRLLGDIFRLTRFSILQEKPPFIGFEAGARLRTPGEVFSIRRIEGVVSAPGLVEIFLGFGAVACAVLSASGDFPLGTADSTAIGTTKISLFVLVASTSSILLV